MNTLLDIIETTPQSITRKQGGSLWLISTPRGLLHLYRAPARDCVPVTVFIRDNGVRAYVRYLYSEDMYYATGEF